MRDPAAAAESAAAARAKASGKAVAVGALTTATSLVTAEPDGTMAGSSSVLPVRVLTRAGWVPVDTSLRSSGGRLVPVAVPGDAVSFSAGGTGPAVEIWAGRSGVRLWWPRALPAPSVSGSSAVYRNVLPGVNLVLTATSAQTGGFSDVLVMTSREAAGDPGLARLMWRVAAPGTSGLRVVAGGGLAARVAGWGGWFEAARPVMWDSSLLRPGASRAAVRGAAEAALAAGASLVPEDLGPASSAAGPAGGARLAAVPARIGPGGQALSLTPDMKLLTSPATRFPVFIAAAGVDLHDVTALEQAYDPVQSDNGDQGCGSDSGACDTGVSCTGPHFDSNSYLFSPVGYDNFGAPGQNCQVNDTDRALYRVGIPSGSLAPNAVIISASLQITEVYSSDCVSTATMTATMINSINQGTAWPGPDAAAGNTDAAKTLGPDPDSCNAIEDTSQRVSAGLNVTADLNALANSATSVTFRVWEAGSPGDVLHKQLTDNPTLEVQWVVKPGLPNSMEEAANSGGSSDPVDCASSSASAQHIGKTDSLDGLYLIAKYAGDGGASVQADIEYKVASASTWTLVKPANSSVASGSQYGFPLPASVTSKLTDGTVMEWQAQAETGQLTIGTTTYGPYASGFTKPCYFAVYPTSPNPPTLAPVGFSETSAQPVGTPVKFTITESAGDTAAKFVWGLDSVPPTSSPPAAQVCSATATAACTALAKNSAGRLFATLTVPVYAPGPHDVTVYEVDAAGNDSGETDGAPTGQTTTFSVAGDPNDQYTGDSSLQANFSDAVNAGKPYDNVMISTQAGVPGNANADGGSGDAIDELQMTKAGWVSGKTVTVDGATFPLPSFGTTADTADNLLSANQTIGTGPGGAHGSALVFLATSTTGNSEVPGIVGTGSGDAGALAAETTAPMVQAGYDVTGQDCSFEVTLNNSTPCTAASGNINYGAGCPSVPGQYILSVPNWVSGPPDLAALEMPDRDHPGGQQADNPKIFVFAVPVNPSCTVMSVTLPDVGPSAYAPALHILGMALRNTTTATPQVGGGMQASPTGQAWTGAFESGIDNADSPPSGQTWGNQTVRIAVSPGVSVPAGSQLRIRLSDPGYYSEDGSGPITIGAASIAQQQSGPAAQQAPIALKFDNGTSAVVPEGGDVYSDPTQPLPFAIAPGQDLLVSLYLQNASLLVLPLNDQPSGSVSWFAPSSPTANLTGTAAGTAFTITGSTFASSIVPLLTGVDVTTTPAVTGPGTTPGEPTVVVTGDGDLIDNNTGTIVPDALNSPSQRLAGQLVSQGDAAGYGVVDGSVASNAIFEDGSTDSLGIPPGGIEFQARVDHDILAEPDVGTVIVDMGLEEVLFQDGAEPFVMSSIVNTLGSVQKQLFAFGMQASGIVFGQLTPCSGYSAGFACDSAADAGRQVVNAGLGELGGSCVADFSNAVAQPGSNPQVLASADDAGDHANLTLGPDGGYAALASMENNNCAISPPQAGWAFPGT